MRDSLKTGPIISRKLRAKLLGPAAQTFIIGPEYKVVLFLSSHVETNVSDARKMCTFVCTYVLLFYLISTSWDYSTVVFKIKGLIKQIVEISFLMIWL